MARRLALAAAALAVLVVAAFVVALLLIDPRAIADALASRAAAAIEQPVALGEVDLTLFPTPAARVRDVVVGEPAHPIAQVDEVRVHVSLLALLVGQVVLRSLELDAPRVVIDLDASGRPRLPAPGERGPATEGATDAGGPWIAITRLSVSDGSVTAGPWQLRELSVDGGAALDGSAQLTVAGVLPGLARIGPTEIELSGFGADEIDWKVRGTLGAVDLAALAARLSPDLLLSGRADTRFSASGRADRVGAAQLELDADDVEYLSGEFALRGPLRAEATLGERFRIDLTQTELVIGAQLGKPAGDALILSGPLGDTPGLDALGEVVVELPAGRLDANLAVGSEDARVTLGESSLELAPIAEWFRGEYRPDAGRVDIESLSVRAGPGPPDLRGRLSLVDVGVALGSGRAVVSGPVRGEGARLVAVPLVVNLEGQELRADLSLDLRDGSIDAVASVDGALLEPVLLALRGDAPVTGTLGGQIRVAGPPEIAALRGAGSFELLDGRLRGFSLMKTVLGELAALPLLVARARGSDLSRYEEEEFRRLAGRFRIADAFAYVDELVLEYRHSTVSLEGTVGLIDGALDLRGQVVISEQLDAELAGSAGGGRERVIPIEGVTGTVEKPRVVLDRDALASALTSYATQGRVKQELEERLGKEGAEAVGDLLEQILRGGREQGQ